MDALATTLNQLVKQGIELERPPYRVRGSGSQICVVRDPDRNLRRVG